jgi:signal transduction histidine kinase
MTLRTKIVALVIGLTLAILAGVGAFLAASFSGWSREAVQRDLELRAREIAEHVEVKRGGQLEVEAENSLLFRDPSHPFRLAGPGGFEVSHGDFGWPPAEEVQDAVVLGADGRPWRVLSRFLMAGESEGEHHRHRDERHRARPQARLLVQVAGLDAPFGGLEERFRHGLLLAIAAALLLGGFGGSLLAHASLSPLRRLESEVDAIGASSLDRRIDPTGLDRELGGLAAAFNKLLGRLDEAMQRQRQFVARASHALRTPTAAVLTRAEVALRRERDGVEYRKALADIAQGARESAALVSHLLTLSRLDERRSALALEVVPLAEVFDELRRLFAPRAEEAGIALELEAPAGASVRADRAALRELLEALLDNALHYTPRGGRAGVAARPGAGRFLLAVWDTGPGIPAEERGQVFDRFRRGSAAAASGRGGSGLGLAIVKAIAEAHAAPLTLGERRGGGLEVTVELVAAGPSA